MADLEDIEALGMFADLLEAGAITEDEFRKVKLRILGSDDAPQMAIQAESPPGSASINSSPQTTTGQKTYKVTLELPADWERNSEKFVRAISKALDDSIDDVRQVLVDRSSVIAITSSREEAEKAILALKAHDVPAFLKISI